MAKKKKERPKSLNFSQEEFENARKFWIRERQKEVFEEEYGDLVDKGKIEESSKIRKLDPFMAAALAQEVAGMTRAEAESDDL